MWLMVDIFHRNRLAAQIHHWNAAEGTTGEGDSDVSVSKSVVNSCGSKGWCQGTIVASMIELAKLEWAMLVMCRSVCMKFDCVFVGSDGGDCRNYEEKVDAKVRKAPKTSNCRACWLEIPWREGWQLERQGLGGCSDEYSGF